MLTNEEIINALNKVDRDLESIIILANPIYSEQLKEFESKCRIEVSPHIPEDIIIFVDSDNYEITETRDNIHIQGIIGGAKHDR